MTDNLKERASVTQADRDAAAELLACNFRAVGWAEKNIAAAIKPVIEGKSDNSDEVQAFARHRLASLPTVSVEARNAVIESALVKCRDKFREYERSHQAKADQASTDPTIGMTEWRDRLAKAARNREMAEMCETALSKSLPTPPEEAQ